MPAHDQPGKGLHPLSLHGPWVLLLLGHQAEEHHWYSISGQEEEESLYLENKPQNFWVRRREEYLKTKANPPSETHSDADIKKSGENPAENSEVIEEAADHKENTSEPSLSFKCEKCDYENKTGKKV